MKHSKYVILLVLCVISFYAGTRFVNNNASQIQVNDKSTVKEKIVTKVVEIPGKSKTTIVTEYRDKKSVVNIKEIKAKKKDWLLNLSIAPVGLDFTKPIYTLGFQRRIVGDLFMGVYGRTDSEYGITVSFTF